MHARGCHDRRRSEDRHGNQSHGTAPMIAVVVTGAELAHLHLHIVPCRRV